MTVSAGTGASSPTRTRTITFGKIEANVDYTKLDKLAREKYPEYFDGVFRLLARDSAVSTSPEFISPQFASLQGEPLTWFVYALHLYGSNSKALPDFDHQGAVARLLDRASAGTYVNVPGAPYEAFEREVLRASGWLAARVLATLTPPSPDDVRNLSSEYNPPGASGGDGRTVGPLQEKVLREKLLPKLVEVVNKQASYWIPPAGTSLPTEPPERLQRFGRFIQAFVALSLRPYADADPAGPYFDGFCYERRLQSTWVLPAGPANQLNYLVNRAKAIGWDADYGAFLVEANYDETRTADKRILTEMLTDRLTTDAELVKRVIVAVKHTGAHTGGAGNISIPPVFPQNWGSAGAWRWRTVRTLVHELLHRLAHPNFTGAADLIRHDQIIREGFVELLTVDIYKMLVTEMTTRGKTGLLLEGVEADALPHSSFYDIGYGAAGAAADRIRKKVGDDRVRAAFFLGATELVGL